MGFATRENVIGAEDRPYVDIEVEEWGGTLRLKRLSGKQRALLDNFIDQQEKANPNSRKPLDAFAIYLSAVKEDGSPLFTKPGDIDDLGAKSLLVLDRIMHEINRLNNFGGEEVEEAVKNSNGDQNSDSGSN